MEITVSSGEINNLKIENEKLIEEISMLKKEIYDLKNTHIHLMIEENAEENAEEEEEEEEKLFEIRDDMSPHEQMSIKTQHLQYLWKIRKDVADWPFTIKEDMCYLETKRRKEALSLYENKTEEEIRAIEVGDEIYFTDGLFIVEMNDEEEFGDILGYIAPTTSNDKNNDEQVIFFN